MTETKICRKCLIEKTLEDFGKDTRVKCGRQANCKTCINTYYRDYFKKNPEARPHKKSPKKHRQMACRYRVNNREKIAAWRRNFKNKHPDTILKNQKRERETLPDWYVKVYFPNKDKIQPTREMVTLKRQQIFMKRTLKQFKKWRLENESNSADVQGIERPDEKNYVRAVQGG